MSSDLKRACTDVSHSSQDSEASGSSSSKKPRLLETNNNTSEDDQRLSRALEAAQSTWLLLDGMSDAQVAEVLLTRLRLQHPINLTSTMIAAALVKFREPATTAHKRVFEAEKCLPKSTAECPIHRALHSASLACAPEEHKDISSFLKWLDEDMRDHLLQGVTQEDKTLCAAVQQTLPFWHWMNGNFSTYYIENDHAIQFEKAGILLNTAERVRLAARWKTLHSPLWFYTLNKAMQAAVVARYHAKHLVGSSA